MSIIDTIDNAIRDYGVSEDAMRWAPEPSREAQFRPMPTVVVRFEVDTREFVLSVGQAREAARRAGLAKLWTWIDETRDWQAAKRERIRRIHQLYRAKRGKQ